MKRVAISGAAAFASGGATNLLIGVPGSISLYSGAELAISSLNNENPNAPMVGAAVGATAGYVAGKIVVHKMNQKYNPWWRDIWSVGPLGIITEKKAGMIPGTVGSVGSSIVQEIGSSLSNKKTIEDLEER